jgi:hypothetical protein
VTVCSDIADYEWLTGDDARVLLNELAEDAAPLHTAVARLRREFSPARAHLLIEQVELRRRARAKFARADQMFFTRIGLEQATDEWTADYKATRFTAPRAGSSPTPAFADLCCGIGGDLLAIAEHSAAIGIDRNPVAAHLAAANAGAATRIANVDELDLADFDAWHIDPDRRTSGRRTTSLQHGAPSLATIERLLAQHPNAAVKLAPAAKVPTSWTKRCELEWISRGGECRQLVAWHGRLAHSSGQRRATVLPAACGLAPSAACGSAPRTIIGSPQQPVPRAAQLDRYVFDVDPAVLAAGLQGVLAAEHGLSALDSGPTYLTGPRPLDDAALASFEVAEVLPLPIRRLARHLRERAIGQLEIKKRGVDVVPENLRRDLKLRGENAATLLITRVAGRPAAILARRVR